MPADDCHVRALPIIVREPGPESVGRITRTALFAQFHLAVDRTKAHPRAGVDDHAQPVIAGQIVAPSIGFIAVERAEKVVSRRAGERGFDFARQGLRHRRCPLWEQSGVDEQTLTVAYDEWSPREPIDQRFTVGCGENRIERVAAVRFPVPGRNGQQMKIVIAEHSARSIAQRDDFAQHL